MISFVEEMVNLLYPRRCPICQEILTDRTVLICTSCRKKAVPIGEPKCKKCGKPLSGQMQEYCSDCRSREHFFTKGWAVFPYKKEIKQSVYQFKFHNKREYQEFYASEMVRIYGREILSWKPDAVIPFRTSKEDAQTAFRTLCKGKALLPRDYLDAHQVEKITGIYVPYWLYSCDGSQEAKYKATRVHRWSDSQYVYTKTDHFLLYRGANASFAKIPLDASSKMDNVILESIEPYDYRDMTDFDTAYLSGFLADKYDVEAAVGEARIRERVGVTMDQLIAPSLLGYASAIPYGKQLNIRDNQAKYVLFPVWFLHTRYKDRSYAFAMNGQTGKMTGAFPICPKKSFAWFAGVCAAVTAVVALIQWLFL